MAETQGALTKCSRRYNLEPWVILVLTTRIRSGGKSSCLVIFLLACPSELRRRRYSLDKVDKKCMTPFRKPKEVTTGCRPYQV